MDVTTLKNASYLDEATTLITVPMAKQLLQNNQDNPRPLKTHIADDYARQMRLGRWGRSPEPIVITKSGRLANGQHRVHAIVTSGVEQNIHVVIIEDKDFDNVSAILDQGAPRTAADVLKVDPVIIRPISYLLRAAGIRKVKPEDLAVFVDSEMGKIIEKTAKMKVKGRLWRHSCFRAAMAVAILSGKISKEQAFEVYTTISQNVMTEWPHIFSELYVQMNDTMRRHETSGRSFANDWYMRSLYAFENVNKNTKTIRIYKSYQEEVKTMSLATLYSINPQWGVE
jgi:hypothetical protein